MRRRYSAVESVRHSLDRAIDDLKSVESETEYLGKRVAYLGARDTDAREQCAKWLEEEAAKHWDGTLEQVIGPTLRRLAERIRTLNLDRDGA